MWEPETGAVLLTLSIPRGQVAMASGMAEADATSFSVSSRVGDPHAGIITNPFLDYAFHTVSFTMTVTVSSDGEWSYMQDTVLEVRGGDGPFHHTDRNTLTRLAPPVPNPLSRPAPST